MERHEGARRTRRAWRRLGRAVWIGAAGFLLASCTSGSTATHERGRVVVPLTDVHVITTSDELARVVDVQPAGDGSVWVLNSVAPFFFHFGADGHVERSFGQQGGGPDEFGYPVTLARGPGPGEIWTFDVSRNALRRVSGGEPREVRLPTDSLPLGSLASFQEAATRPGPPWMHSVANGFLVGRRPSGSSAAGALGLWHTDIVRLRLDSTGVSMEPYRSVSDLLGDPATQYPGATILLPYPIWAVCADGTLGLYDPLANALRRFGPEGAEGDTLSLPPEQRLPVTFDRLFQMVFRQLWEQQPAAQRPDSDRMRQILETQFEQSKSTLADVFPEYADLRCTSGRTFWLQPFDVPSGRFGRGPRWLRIAGDGSRTEVTFPDELTPFRFEEGRIWGTVVDSLGVASVAWVGTGD